MFQSESIVIDFEATPFVSLSAKINDWKESAILEYRYKDRWSAWSDWQAFVVDEHAPQNENIYFGIEYLPENIGKIQVRLRGGDFSNQAQLDLYIFAPEDVPIGSFEKSGSAQDSCDCPIPSFSDRQQWCAGNCPPDPTPEFTETSHVIVHHSAGSNVSTNWAAVVQSIWDYHTVNQGWDDIGYNWLIDPNGVIYEGRGDSLVGAHFSCANENTAGICLLGNFETGQVSQAAMTSLVKLAGWYNCKYHFQSSDSAFHIPTAMVLQHMVGHRDGNPSTSPTACFSGTVCPGQDLYQQLSLLHAETDAYTDSCVIEAAGPDLVVVNLEPSNPYVLLNDVVTFESSFGNTGGSNYSDSVGVAYYLNGQLLSWDSIPGIYLGQHISSVSSNHVANQVGQNEICVYADELPNEANSLNNSYCVQFLVYAPTGVSAEIPSPQIRSIATGWILDFEEHHQVVLHDAMGRKINSLDGTSIILDMTNYTSGMYFITSINGSGSRTDKVLWH